MAGSGLPDLIAVVTSSMASHSLSEAALGQSATFLYSFSISGMSLSIAAASPRAAAFLNLSHNF